MGEYVKVLFSYFTIEHICTDYKIQTLFVLLKTSIKISGSEWGPGQRVNKSRKYNQKNGSLTRILAYG